MTIIPQGRLRPLILALALACILGLPYAITTGMAEDDHEHGGDEHAHDEDGHAEEGLIALTPQQIFTSGIKTATIGPGKIAQEVLIPGKVMAADDHIAQIVPKVSGTVTEALKNLNDPVEKGEVLALIESREMAEAIADYLAAKRTADLGSTTFNREKGLWDKKISSERVYLNAKNVYEEAQIRLDLTRQKLQALGHDTEMLAAVDKAPNADGFRFFELRSPLKGRVIGRELMLGEYVDSTHSAYTVADLATVWVEVGIAPGDLPFVKEDQMTRVVSDALSAEGKLIVLSPVIDTETRLAKAIIELDNADEKWHPGQFVNAAIATSSQDVKLVIPKEAMQTIEGKPTIFIRTDKGFEKRAIATGREDSRNIEVLSGVKPGEIAAISGTFTLKAELGKAEAEHSH